MTRGMDCNNPMNLETTSLFRWKGELRPTVDPEEVLCDFVSTFFGIRAGALDLYNQQILHGLKTWREIINKYAPPSENDTEAYIQAVCKATDVRADDVIDLSDPAFLVKAVHAVIHQEQGKDPFNDRDILEAISTFLDLKGV